MKIKKDKAKLVNKLNFRKQILWLFVVVAIAIGTVVTVEIATSGAEIAKFESEEANLKEENFNLSQALIKNTSLKTLESGAESFGFRQPENSLYLTQGEGVAARLP